MKKIVVGLFIVMFCLAFVMAVQEGKGVGSEIDDSVKEEIAQLFRERVRTGNYTDEEGNQFEVREMAQNKLRIHAGDIEADTDLNVTQERVQNKTKLKVQLTNGRNAEIKVMPDVASKRALERLRLKICSAENNCTIQLNEVGQDKVGYEVRAEKQTRVLGLFRAKMKVLAEVNAENGEVIRTKKPWWAFLASEE